MHPLHHPLIIPNWPTSASLFLAWFRIRFVHPVPPVTTTKRSLMISSWVFDTTQPIFARWLFFWKTLWKTTLKVENTPRQHTKKTPAAETQDLPPSCLTSHWERESFPAIFLQGHRGYVFREAESYWIQGSLRYQAIVVIYYIDILIVTQL